MITLPFLASGCLSAPPYKGPKTSHFDGERFHNHHPFDGSLMDILKWQLTKERTEWPKWVEERPSRVPQERVGQGEISATFINHATVLLQIDGINILTDPIWSERCSPLSWIGPKRARAPGVRLEDLPPIDLVLISHNHYDHLDLPTLKILAEKDQPTIIVGLGNQELLNQEKIPRSKELDWWQELPFQHLKITFVPARHFSGRGLTDRMKTLWGGFVIEGKKGQVYFAGDTGFDQHFEQIAQKFTRIQLSLLPIGAYEPRWFMQKAHINPQEAVLAHKILRTKKSMGIHFGTFQLTDEGIDTPVLHLKEALQREGVPEEDFWVLPFGHTRKL